MAKKTIKKVSKKIIKNSIKSKSIKKTTKSKKTISKSSKNIKNKSIKSIMQKIEQKIKKTMLITEITRTYPECALIMMNHGLYCVGCGVAMYETLEDGARAHGMSDMEIDSMIKEMNSAVQKK